MCTKQQGAGEVTNYVIVEVTCRIFGRGQAKLLTSFWFGDRRCPRCKGKCECLYLGHGFTMDHFGQEIDGSRETQLEHHVI